MKEKDATGWSKTTDCFFENIQGLLMAGYTSYFVSKILAETVPPLTLAACLDDIHCLTGILL